MYSGSILFFFFNDTATTEIYTLSLHDALPISRLHEYPSVDCHPHCLWKSGPPNASPIASVRACSGSRTSATWSDRKSTRLNSSHVRISYAVFCLKKKNKPLQLQRSGPQHDGPQ